MNFPSRFACLVVLVLASLLIACRESATSDSGQMDMTLPDVPLIASYDIAVSLDPANKQLRGSETIRYLNTKPEPFSELVFHLYLNGFQEGSYFMSTGSGLRGFGFDKEAPGYITVDALRVNGQRQTLELVEDGTLARVDLPFAVAEGETVEVTLDFEAQLPRAVARTGFGDDDFFMVGQWFPKLGVWEDGDWNAYPFYPNNEFYADFGAYDVAITVPSDFVVGGSGLEVASNNNGDGTKTVRYHAEPVVDFAWTASPNFEIATRDVMGVELYYLYLPEENGDTSDRLLTAAAHGMRTNADWFGPYPYERLTLVDVPPNAAGAGGMEYPTLVTVGALGAEALGPLAMLGIRDIEVVTIHEVGHQWFQSMVATNEVEEPWLDEGMSDYATTLGMTAGYGQANTFDSYLLDVDGMEVRRIEYLTSAMVPMLGTAEELENYGVSTYSKPNIGLVTLQRTLGDALMKEVMRTYFMRYRFKHPTTKDFRAVAEEVSGQNLDWFFDGMVDGRGVLNYAVSELTTFGFTAVRQGGLFIPTEVLVTFEDASAEIIQWDTDTVELSRTFEQPIASVEIDPERKVLMDMYWSDNGRTNSADFQSWINIITRWLYKAQDLSLLLGGL